MMTEVEVMDEAQRNEVSQWTEIGLISIDSPRVLA